MPLKYRKDIDGLRAIAVLAVLGFHAFPNLMPGGFIGVDIFFVISGYLIGSILLEGIKNGKFSLINFYQKRILRIFPALLLVIISCYLIGWFYFLTTEYSQLGLHIAASSIFVQNYNLWNESSYFNNSQDTKPLLHLWSLSIEEQFYIFWPLILILARKVKLNLLLVTTLFALASFVLNVRGINVTHDLVATFYSPQTRFWELLVGTIIGGLEIFYISTHKCKYIYLLKQFSNIISVFGLLLILVGLLIITKNLNFPGWWALLPVSGTALLIVAGEDSAVSRLFLSNKLLVSIGLISYPLYLWHWALLSIYTIIVIGGRPGSMTICYILLTSLVLSVLTYRYVEKPLRFGGDLRIKRLKASILLVSFLILGSVGFFTFASDGLGTRKNISAYTNFIDYFENSEPNRNYFQKINEYENYREDCNYSYVNSKPDQIGYMYRGMDEISTSCTELSPGKKSIFLWGDSHIQMLYAGLKKNLPDEWNIQIIRACTPKFIESDPKSLDFCDRMNYKVSQFISKNPPDIVLLGQVRHHDFEGLVGVGRALKRQGVKRIIVAGPATRWRESLPELLVRAYPFSFEGVTRSLHLDNENNKLDEKLEILFKGSEFEYASLIKSFCNSDGCMVKIGNDLRKTITTWDYGHLTPTASDFIAKELLVPLILKD